MIRTGQLRLSQSIDFAAKSGESLVETAMPSINLKLAYSKENWYFASLALFLYSQVILRVDIVY